MEEYNECCNTLDVNGQRCVPMMLSMPKKNDKAQNWYNGSITQDTNTVEFGQPYIGFETGNYLEGGMGYKGTKHPALMKNNYCVSKADFGKVSVNYMKYRTSEDQDVENKKFWGQLHNYMYDQDDNKRHNRDRNYSYFKTANAARGCPNFEIETNSDEDDTPGSKNYYPQFNPGKDDNYKTEFNQFYAILPPTVQCNTLDYQIRLGTKGEEPPLINKKLCNKWLNNVDNIDSTGDKPYFQSTPCFTSTTQQNPEDSSVCYTLDNYGSDLFDKSNDSNTTIEKPEIAFFDENDEDIKSFIDKKTAERNALKTTEEYITWDEIWPPLVLQWDEDDETYKVLTDEQKCRTLGGYFTELCPPPLASDHDRDNFKKSTDKADKQNFFKRRIDGAFNAKSHNNWVCQKYNRTTCLGKFSAPANQSISYTRNAGKNPENPEILYLGFNTRCIPTQDSKYFQQLNPNDYTDNLVECVNANNPAWILDDNIALAEYQDENNYILKTKGEDSTDGNQEGKPSSESNKNDINTHACDVWPQWMNMNHPGVCRNYNRNLYGPKYEFSERVWSDKGPYEAMIIAKNNKEGLVSGDEFVTNKNIEFTKDDILKKSNEIINFEDFLPHNYEKNQSGSNKSISQFFAVECSTKLTNYCDQTKPVGSTICLNNECQVSSTCSELDNGTTKCSSNQICLKSKCTDIKVDSNIGRFENISIRDAFKLLKYQNLQNKVKIIEISKEKPVNYDKDWIKNENIMSGDILDRDLVDIDCLRKFIYYSLKSCKELEEEGKDCDIQDNDDQDDDDPGAENIKLYFNDENHPKINNLENFPVKKKKSNQIKGETLNFSDWVNEYNAKYEDGATDANPEKILVIKKKLKLKLHINDKNIIKSLDNISIRDAWTKLKDVKDKINLIAFENKIEQFNRKICENEISPCTGDDICTLNCETNTAGVYTCENEPICLTNKCPKSGSTTCSEGQKCKSGKCTDAYYISSVDGCNDDINNDTYDLDCIRTKIYYSTSKCDHETEEDLCIDVDNSQFFIIQAKKKSADSNIVFTEFPFIVKKDTPGIVIEDLERVDYKYKVKIEVFNQTFVKDLSINDITLSQKFPILNTLGDIPSSKDVTPEPPDPDKIAAERNQEILTIVLGCILTMLLLFLGFIYYIKS